MCGSTGCTACKEERAVTCIASPANLMTSPPCRKTMSIIFVKNSLMYLRDTESEKAKRVSWEPTVADDGIASFTQRWCGEGQLFSWRTG